MGSNLRKVILSIIEFILPLVFGSVAVSVFGGENQTALETFLALL